MERVYVRADKVERKKSEGWKVVEDYDYADLNLNQANQERALKQKDLILMEK